mgnify:CR=1 FL=1
MNAQNAHEYLPLVQALAEGKQLQYEVPNGWSDIDQIKFTEPAKCYRIKPEPRKFEMWLTPARAMYSVEEIAERRIEGWERITVQEVLK